MSSSHGRFPGVWFPAASLAYNSVLTREAKNLIARIFAWPERDVIEIQIDDRRAVAHRYG